MMRSSKTRDIYSIIEILRHNVKEASTFLSDSDKDILNSSLENVLLLVSGLKTFSVEHKVSHELIHSLSGVGGNRKAVDDLFQHVSRDMAMDIGIRLKKEGAIKTSEIEDLIQRVKVIKAYVTVLS